MPRKRTWLLIVAAALLVWMRPWRRLARRLQPAASGAPHPEVAFAGADTPPSYTPGEAERLADQTARGDQARPTTLAAGAAQPLADDTPEFASPVFFGPGDQADDEAVAAANADQAGPEPDLIDEILAMDDELDAAAVLGALAPGEADTVANELIAAQVEAMHGDPAQAQPVMSDPAEAAPTPNAEQAATRPEDLAATQLVRSDEDGEDIIELVAEQVEALQADPDNAMVVMNGSAPDDDHSAPALREAEVGVSEPARPDDLLIIEGIGPRTSTIVTAAGITSFAQLAEADVETLRDALLNAGIKTVDPTTWPEQARLAGEGRWDDLKELQRSIKNGRKQG